LPKRRVSKGNTVTFVLSWVEMVRIEMGFEDVGYIHLAWGSAIVTMGSSMAEVEGIYKLLTMTAV
jgi:hypothetical protein